MKVETKDERFSTDILESALKKKRKICEKKRQEIIKQAILALTRLSKKVEFSEAYIFGSAIVKGRFSLKSDVDVGFVGLKSGDVIKVASFLSSELGIDVDVIQLEDFPFANKIIKEGIRWKRKR